jgi:uncharacterized peroxidase-related enzyme
MPHIAVSADLYGIVGLMDFKPATGARLRELAQQLLRGPSSLSAGQRELIAAYVSRRNECEYCERTHTATARELLDPDHAVTVDQPRVDGRMTALLRIAAHVQQGGRLVSENDVGRARAAGASDEDIHDTVLIAAAFCMFNRYVDGLAASMPPDEETFDRLGEQLAECGYVASST